ncbi:SMP-30/gluconolactonase/LRE family protein [Streptomyces sp. NPDC096132]|uniref:SMP-30/gluconolactonase/LRE family protein n=1 Tax=Streptomyces sp. NPDC096132 TaxID=3366075 RepID=UPI003817321B
MSASSISAKRRIRTAAIATAASAVLVSAPSAAASTPTPHEQLVITDIRTVAEFDYAAGEIPENITVNPDRSVTLSMIGAAAGKAPALVRVSPSGHRTVLATSAQGDGITGNIRGKDGTVYYNVWSSSAARAGVWKIAPGKSPARLAALPTDGLPNGMALDTDGRTIYVADSLKSTVWAVPVAGGPAKAWLTDPALAPVTSEAVPFGANGLRFHKGAVWVSNLAQDSLLRIPVTGNGKPGRIHVVTKNIDGVDDFSFLNDHSDVVFAAQNAPDKVSVVYPGGQVNTVLTGADGLASPSATAVSDGRLYVTDGGLNAPHDAQLQRGKINVSALCSHASS